MLLELSALNVAAIVAWAVVALWAAGFFLTVKGIARQNPLAPSGEKLPALSSQDTPLVSVLIPARNEADRILADCVRSVAAQDYPRLEIIAVNDRSTDATGDILREVAGADDRVRVIDGREPPAGWLGKPHALDQALRAAGGEWVLATDADMIYDPRAVRTALAHAVAGGYDAVTLIPHIDCFSFWERVFMPTFGWFMLMVMPVDRVNDPQRRESIGIGGFFLIRRTALEGVGGYAAVRADVAEDLRTAEHLKRSGARLRLEYAPTLISTRMQTNLAEIWEGFTRNLFAGTNYSVARTAFGAAAVLLFSVLPPLVALAYAITWIAGVGDVRLSRLALPTFVVWLLQVATFAAVNATWRVPLRYALTAPLGHALFTMILINSTLRIALGSGVKWKGRTLYDRAGGVTPPGGGGTT